MSNLNAFLGRVLSIISQIERSLNAEDHGRHGSESALRTIDRVKTQVRGGDIFQNCFQQFYRLTNLLINSLKYGSKNDVVS